MQASHSPLSPAACMGTQGSSQLRAGMHGHSGAAASMAHLSQMNSASSQTGVLPRHKHCPPCLMGALNKA